MEYVHNTLYNSYWHVMSRQTQLNHVFRDVCTSHTVSPVPTHNYKLFHCCVVYVWIVAGLFTFDLDSLLPAIHRLLTTQAKLIVWATIGHISANANGSELGVLFSDGTSYPGL